MNKETLQQVFDKDFEDAGDNFKSLCPFHEERTGSFYVHKDDLMANCFGCGAHGYIDVLVANYKGISTVDARKLLDVSVSEKIRKKLIRGDYREPPRVFPESWLAPFERKIHKYVTERGFQESTLSGAGALWDSRTKRQVFPHRDGEGRLLGAAGRSCVYEDPKWYFYWGYSKGRSLYRINHDRVRRLILVEGIFDALWLHQYGYSNVAATLGSKVTPFQIREVVNTAEEVIIIGDNDASGKEFESKLFTGLTRSVPTYFVRLPETVKDVQDLAPEQIRPVVEAAETRLQRVVNHVSRTTV